MVTVAAHLSSLWTNVAEKKTIPKPSGESSNCKTEPETSFSFFAEFSRNCSVYLYGSQTYTDPDKDEIVREQTNYHQVAL